MANLTQTRHVSGFSASSVSVKVVLQHREAEMCLVKFLWLQ